MKRIALLLKQYPYCDWILPNDAHYAYLMPCFRNWGDYSVVEYAQEMPPRTYSDQMPFLHSVGCHPYNSEHRELLARLIWCPDLGVEEVWLLLRSAECASSLAQSAPETEIRTLPLVYYASYSRQPISCLRFQSERALQAYLASAGSVHGEQLWLTFSGLPSEAFHSVQLTEGADLLLFERFLRGTNLDIAFRSPYTLSEGWKATLKQDMWKHETGDPLCCVSTEHGVRLENYLHTLAQDYAYEWFESLLTKPILYNFLQGADIHQLRPERR